MGEGCLVRYREMRFYGQERIHNQNAMLTLFWRPRKLEIESRHTRIVFVDETKHSITINRRYFSALRCGLLLLNRKYHQFQIYTHSDSDKSHERRTSIENYIVCMPYETAKLCAKTLAKTY